MTGKIEGYEKFFGVFAIEMGFITPEQLIEALKVQVKDDVDGKSHKLVGQILLEKGFISPEQIQKVLDSIFNK